MSKASSFYQGLHDAITNAVQSVAPFRAKVHAVLSSGVQLQQYGADTPMDEPYARLAGPPIAANDDVAVIQLGGRPFVLGKVQTSPPSQYDYDATVHTTGSLHADADASVGGNLAVSGFGSVMGGLAVTGTGVSATSFNSPIVRVHTVTTPITASTTTLSTWVDMANMTVALPLGTWTVYVHAIGRMAHSSSSNPAFRVVINGTGGSFTQGFADPTYTTLSAVGSKTGCTGTITIEAEFYNLNAGTLTAGHTTFLVIATRTS